MLTTTQINVVGNFRDNIYNLLVFPKFQSFLREIAKTDGLADIKLTTVGLYFSQEHFDESRLTCAVVAHNAHFLESCKVVVEVI